MEQKLWSRKLKRKHWTLLKIKAMWMTEKQSAEMRQHTCVLDMSCIMRKYDFALVKCTSTYDSNFWRNRLMKFHLMDSTRVTEDVYGHCFLYRALYQKVIKERLH